MKKIIVILFFIFTFTCFISSTEKFTLSTFDEFMNQYYVKSENDKLFDAILFSSKNIKLNKDDLKPICLSFYSSIFRKDKNIMNDIYSKIVISKDNNLKYYFIDILWLTNTDDSNNILKNININDDKIKNYSKERFENPYDFLNDKIQVPLQLDMLWGAFFGSGDVIYIKKIISTLDLKINGHGIDMATGGAAEWSLGSNAKYHTEVYKIIKNEIENNENSKEITEILKKIIEDVGGK